MTDKKITAWYTANPITLDPGDIFPVTENTGTTPATGAAKISQLMRDVYTLTQSIASSNLTVALKHLDGTDPSADRPLYVKVGNSVIGITAALSATINASYGDVFLWDAGKIQANDAQLFVYIINNNGTPQLGLSPSPMLTTVATNYRDAGGQTGSAKHTNIIMSGTRNATNSCDVIGRVNVNQLDNNNWQSPTTSLIVNRPIYHTDQMTWTPSLSAPGGTLTFSSTTFLAAKYSIDKNTLRADLYFTTTAGGTSGTDFYATAPIQSALAATGPMVTGSILFADSSATPAIFGGSFLSSGTPDKFTFRKYNQANWHNSGTIIINAANNGYITV